MSLSLGELAVRFGCELRGDPDARVARVATLANAAPGTLAFLANPLYRAQLAATRATAVVLTAAAADACPTAVLVSANPYATYARIADVLHPPAPLVPGVHPSALVARGAHVDPSAEVGALAVIGEHVSSVRAAFVGPQCVLESGVTLDCDVRLVARATLGRGVQIGARTILQPGVVIGGDGFGFAPERGAWLKVPQVGSVRVGADVEIGANTTIDRGAIEDTVIEEGVKLDNLIMIAHNVRIGAHTVIAGCVGISGSTTIGKRCMIGGHCGLCRPYQHRRRRRDHRRLDDHPLDRARWRILQPHPVRRSACVAPAGRALQAPRSARGARAQTRTGRRPENPEQDEDDD